MSDREELWRKARSRVNSPKHALMEIVSKMRSEGLNRKASSLETLIRKIEDWQNQ